MTVEVRPWYETGGAGSGQAADEPRAPSLQAEELARLLMDSPALAARVAELAGGRGATGRAGSRLTELLSRVPYGAAAGGMADQFRDRAAPYVPGTQGTVNPDWQLSTPDPGSYDMGAMGWLPSYQGLNEKLGLDQLEQLYRQPPPEPGRFERMVPPAVRDWFPKR